MKLPKLKSAIPLRFEWYAPGGVISQAKGQEDDAPDIVFESYYGGSREGYDFLFDPRTKCFYYADDCFNTYKPEPWVRKITRKEIRELIGG